MPAVEYSNAYTTLIARALDIFLGTSIWRDYGVTISSMCGLQLRTAKPAWWAVLIGRNFLERFWPGHCEGAIAADILRAHQALKLLGDPCSIHS
jgi:hypothetical protein